MITSYKKFLEKREEIEREEELEKKRKKNIYHAQITNSPTYYDHVSKTIEMTPSMSNRKQSLSYIKQEMK
jgi:cytidylate kinase